MAQHYFLQKLYSSSRPNESMNKINTTRRFDTLMHVIYKKNSFVALGQNSRTWVVRGYSIISYKTSIKITENPRITISFYGTPLYMVKKFLHYIRRLEL